jgi:hypothetical protein
VPPRIRWQERTTTSIIKIIFQKNYAGQRDAGPTRGFAASPEVGSGATVGILQIEYHRIQASSQDKGHGVHPRAATRTTAPDHATPLR